MTFIEQYLFFPDLHQLRQIQDCPSLAVRLVHIVEDKTVENALPGKMRVMPYKMEYETCSCQDHQGPYKVVLTKITEAFRSRHLLHILICRFMLIH